MTVTPSMNPMETSRLKATTSMNPMKTRLLLRRNSAAPLPRAIQLKYLAWNVPSRWQTRDQTHFAIIRMVRLPSVLVRGAFADADTQRQMLSNLVADVLTSDSAVPQYAWGSHLTKCNTADLLYSSLPMPLGLGAACKKRLFGSTMASM